MHTEYFVPASFDFGVGVGVGVFRNMYLTADTIKFI